MAQMQREPVESVTKETTEKKILDGGSSASKASSFKFNAQAPEFVPRSHATALTPQVSPISGYFYPCFHYNELSIGGCSGGGGVTGGSQSSDWIFVGGGDPVHHQNIHDPTAAFYVSNPVVQFPANQNLSSSSKSLLSDDLRLKIVKQVLTFFVYLLVMSWDQFYNLIIWKHDNGYLVLFTLFKILKIL